MCFECFELMFIYITYCHAPVHAKVIIIIIIKTNIIRVSLSKNYFRTLFKVKMQNKIRCAQLEKIKGKDGQKDAFSGDT